MGNAVFDADTIEGIEVKTNVKIVGIIFAKDKAANEIKENWEGRLEKIKKIIKSWMRRNLTIIGKIQVIKTFLLSQLVYIMQSILINNEIINEINTLFYRFIWKKDTIDKKAWERVKRIVLCNAKVNGGMEMINLHVFQKSFLLDWACKLLKEDQEDWKTIPISFLKSLGGLSVFKNNVDSKTIIGLENVTSKFWKSVICAWLENNETDGLIRLNDTINNNRHIIMNNQVLYIERAIQFNILYLRDMFLNGQIISFDMYELKVGRYHTNIFDYLKIKSAILKIKDKIIDNEDNQMSFKLKQINNIDRKKIYQLIKKDEKCFCEAMWENRFGYKLCPETWNNLFKNIKETKLLEMQWKILHNIYPTNVILKKIGIKQTEKCDFCNEIDYVEHTFFNCNRLKMFWEAISSLINKKLNKKIYLSEKSVLLGIEQEHHNLRKEELKFINLIILIGKLSIIKSKFYQMINLNTLFEKEVNLREVFL